MTTDAAKPLDVLEGTPAALAGLLENSAPSTQIQLGLSFDKMPYVGKPFLRKESDPDSHQPQYRQIIHVKTFMLWDSDQLAAYEEVMQQVSFQKGEILDIQREYVTQEKNFIVYLHWFDHVMVAPDIADNHKLVRMEFEANTPDIPPKEV